jgi:hypothetical protein
LPNKRTNHSYSRNEEEEETPVNQEDQRRERREIALLVIAIIAVLALALHYGSDSGFTPFSSAEQAAGPLNASLSN